MAYSCLKNHNKECNGCGDCKHSGRKTSICCTICDEPLREDEVYYMLGKEIVCECCLPFYLDDRRAMA